MRPDFSVALLNYTVTLKTRSRKIISIGGDGDDRSFLSLNFLAETPLLGPGCFFSLSFALKFLLASLLLDLILPIPFFLAIFFVILSSAFSITQNLPATLPPYWLRESITQLGIAVMCSDSSYSMRCWMMFLRR